MEFRRYQWHKQILLGGPIGRNCENELAMQTEWNDLRFCASRASFQKLSRALDPTA